ncbi:MAG: site-2 protease family protein [Dehalococcoidia bacterium]
MSITLLRIFGIPFRVNYTWLVIFGLVITSLALYQLPDSNPTWSTAEYWLIATITTFLFFTSVVLHELSHAIFALRHGLPVRSITLFIFGGVAHIAREAERPRAEAFIALAGPVSSLLIAGAFYLLYQFVGPHNEQVGAISAWLAVVNVALAAFNMVPGFPMDGGRVLRSVIWAISGDYRKATRISTWVGRSVAYLMILGGAILLFTGDWASGVWLMFIGLFIDNAAMANYKHTMLRETLRERLIGDFMAPIPAAAAYSTGAPMVEITDNANRVMEEMEEKGIREALVVRGGVVVGVVRKDTLGKWKGS